MVFVDSTGIGWPRCLEDKNTFNVITFQLLACNGIKNGRLNTEGRGEQGLVSIVPGNGGTTIDPVSVCL